MDSHTIKRASPDHPVLDVIAQRWSPYAYEPVPMDMAKLKTCLEAGRWAASSYNEQPWSIIVAVRQDEAAWTKLMSCLVEANQAWAKDTSALMLTVASRKFSRNGKPNRVAEHDVGMFTANLALQAAALGLQAHEMAGIEPSKARQLYNIPEDHDPCTAVAIGTPRKVAQGDTGDLEQRDLGPRSRKPFSDWLFGSTWGQAAGL